MKTPRALSWIANFGGERRRAPRTPLLASRDLPAPDSQPRPRLPQAPEPWPDEALRFARHGAARRSAPRALPAMLVGAELRAVLDGIGQGAALRESPRGPLLGGQRDQALERALETLRSLAGERERRLSRRPGTAG